MYQGGGVYMLTGNRNQLIYLNNEELVTIKSREITF